MHRIDTPTAQKDKFGAGKNGFTKGDPQTGTPATEIDEMILDAVQEEICAVIEGSGSALSKDDKSQLLKSINKLIDRKTKYGCPLIGELIEWPHQLMPHEVFPDIGMHFIPYIGQPFDKSRFPLLAMIHPGGVLPADMRGEFPRGWDNGRGVDPGRVLMSAKGYSTSAEGLKINMQRSSGNTGSPMPLVNGGNNVLAFNANGSANVYSEVVSSTSLSSTATETASRSVAWNMITRTS